MGRGRSGSGGGGKKGSAKNGFKVITNAKSFNDVYGDDIYDEVNKVSNLNDWLLKNLPNDQRDAIELYTSNYYEVMNPGLRSGENENDLSHLSESDQAAVKSIDAAIKDFELKEPIEVWRGSSAALLGGVTDIGQLKGMIGATVYDQAFVSTSVKKGSAFGGSIVYKILVPAGKNHGAYISEISQFKGEREFLLKRNSPLRIVAVGDAGDGKPLVTLQVVDE